VRAGTKLAIAAALGTSSTALALSWPVHMIYFRAGSTPNASAAEEVRALARQAREMAAGVVIAGHTDRMGSVEANRRLSCARARAVRAMFLAHGIPPDHIVLHGFGELRPRVETRDEVPHLENRRAEVTLTPLPMAPRGKTACI
jgi:outer membrane protein OmpA-like peptidoglycan-associated protein